MPSRLGFIVNALDRHSAERDGDLIALHQGDPAARSILVAGEILVLAARGEGATALLEPEAFARAPAPQERAYLGTLEGVPVLAGLFDPAAADAYRDDPAFRVMDLRSIAVQGAVPEGELGILAEAKAILHWHARHRFCSNCGAPTALAQSGFRRDCQACGGQHFPRTDPVVIMLVHRGDRCLLARQPRFVPGMHSCLAGFVEPGETIEDAVRRETFEEAGIRVGEVRYLASQPWPFPMSLMIGCLGEALNDEIVLDGAELEAGRWFSRDEALQMLERRHPDGLTSPPPMAIAHHLMRAFVEGR